MFLDNGKTFLNHTHSAWFSLYIKEASNEFIKIHLLAILLELYPRLIELKIYIYYYPEPSLESTSMIFKFDFPI